MTKLVPVFLFLVLRAVSDGASTTITKKCTTVTLTATNDTTTSAATQPTTISGTTTCKMMGSSPSTTLLNCICLCESGCKNLSCKWDVNGEACGYYQIHFPYFQDCNIPANPGESHSAAWKRCSGDLTCSTECVKNYLSCYGDSCAGATASNQDFARVHNGGPTGCARRCSGKQCNDTATYWSRIKAICPNL